MEGNEQEMVSTLEERDDNNELDAFDASIILKQACFWTLKAFNTVCDNSYSDVVKDHIEEYIPDLKQYLKTHKVDNI